MFSIIILTIKEAMVKKTIFTFFIISTIICILLLFVLDIKFAGFDSKSILMLLESAEMTGEKGQLPSAEKAALIIQSIIAGMIYLASLGFSLVSTGNFFPSLLQKGVIDLILTKPISRTSIFAGRFLGVFLVVAANIIYLTLFSAVIIYLKLDVWNNGFILSSIITLLVFAILFALISFFGIIFRSSGIALIATLGTMFFISPLLSLLKHFGKYAGVSSGVLDFFYYILPKIGDLGKMVIEIVLNEATESYMPLYSSLLFGMVIYFTSLIIFKKKDF